MFCYQEELSQRKDIEQDSPMLPAVEVVSACRPVEQKLDKSKREAADDD